MAKSTRMAQASISTYQVKSKPTKIRKSGLSRASRISSQSLSHIKLHHSEYALRPQQARQAQRSKDDASQLLAELQNMLYLLRPQWAEKAQRSKDDASHLLAELQNMLYLLRPQRAGKAQRSKDDASHLLAELQNMLYLLRPQRAGKAQRSKDDASHLLAELLQEHWIYCNIYTIHVKNIQKHILALYMEFISLKLVKQGKADRISDTFRTWKISTSRQISCLMFSAEMM